MAFDKSALKDYVDVAERIRAWYDAYPNGRIETRIVEHNEKRVVIEARAYRGVKGDSGPSDELGFIDDRPAGVGHSAMQIPGATPYTRGSEIENCETSAVGRALVMAGLPSKRIASDDEIKAKREDSPRATDSDGVIKETKSKKAAPAPLADEQVACDEWSSVIVECGTLEALQQIGLDISKTNLSVDSRKYLADVYKARREAIVGKAE
jgi:hypothetical protein